MSQTLPLSSVLVPFGEESVMISSSHTVYNKHDNRNTDQGLGGTVTGGKTSGINLFGTLGFFCNLLFQIGVQLINNVVLVSGVQQSDSVIHIDVSILFQILFPIRLLQNIEQSSLCCTVVWRQDIWERTHSGVDILIWVLKYTSKGDPEAGEKWEAFRTSERTFRLDRMQQNPRILELLLPIRLKRRCFPLSTISLLQIAQQKAI